jgi:hypothetical protein
MLLLSGDATNKPLHNNAQCRLCFENKAHYADGMKRDDYTNIRQAISFEINEPVERAFPKQCKEPMRTKIKTRQNTARGSTFTLNDILYLKCS